jgi:acetyl-CoA acetyltransferase
MKTAFLADGVRTPIGNFGGSLSTVRTDDLAAHVLKGIMDRNPDMDPECIGDVLMGCANQAGEDNRNVARMALLLAGFRSPYREKPSTGFALPVFLRWFRQVGYLPAAMPNW